MVPKTKTGGNIFRAGIGIDASCHLQEHKEKPQPWGRLRLVPILTNEPRGGSGYGGAASSAVITPSPRVRSDLECNSDSYDIAIARGPYRTGDVDHGGSVDRAILQVHRDVLVDWPLHPDAEGGT